MKKILLFLAMFFCTHLCTMNSSESEQFIDAAIMAYDEAEQQQRGSGIELVNELLARDDSPAHDISSFVDHIEQTEQGFESDYRKTLEAKERSLLHACIKYGLAIAIPANIYLCHRLDVSMAWLPALLPQTSFMFMAMAFFFLHQRFEEQLDEVSPYTQKVPQYQTFREWIKAAAETHS